MRKVAIITINSMNYGNRLQNYALQRIIASMGFEVETIRRNNYRWDESIVEKGKDLLRVLFQTKKGLFWRFDKDNIVFSKYYANQNDIDKAVVDEYDYFITGSDQVWNPYYDYFLGINDLLVFAPEQKRISYAASFGVDTIPEEKKRIYSDALKGYKAISVREGIGVDIVRDLTGREAVLTLDPTFLLSSKEWIRIGKKPKYRLNKQYLLLYFLGNRNELAEKELELVTKEQKLEIVDVTGFQNNGRRMAIGPSEFIWLINNSVMVLTNSFHATVFSIIFNKAVKTYPREGIDISSRIQSLAQITGIDGNIGEDGVLSIGEYEYSKIKKKLDREREKSLFFLRNALD